MVGWWAYHTADSCFLTPWWYVCLSAIARGTSSAPSSVVRVRVDESKSISTCKQTHALHSQPTPLGKTNGPTQTRQLLTNGPSQESIAAAATAAAAEGALDWTAAVAGAEIGDLTELCHLCGTFSYGSKQHSARLGDF